MVVLKYRKRHSTVNLCKINIPNFLLYFHIILERMNFHIYIIQTHIVPKIPPICIHP